MANGIDARLSRKPRWLKTDCWALTARHNLCQTTSEKGVVEFSGRHFDATHLRSLLSGLRLSGRRD